MWCECFFPFVVGEDACAAVPRGSSANSRFAKHPVLLLFRMVLSWLRLLAILWFFCMNHSRQLAFSKRFASHTKRFMVEKLCHDCFAASSKSASVSSTILPLSLSLSTSQLTEVEERDLKNSASAVRSVLTRHSHTHTETEKRALCGCTASFFSGRTVARRDTVECTGNAHRRRKGKLFRLGVCMGRRASVLYRAAHIGSENAAPHRLRPDATRSEIRLDEGIKRVAENINF